MAEGTDPEVMVKDGRLSFSDNLFSPEVGEIRTKGKHKGKIPYRWSFNLLIPKTNTVLIEAIKNGMREARDQQWPKDPPKIKADKMCLRDGDEEEYNGYAGHYYLSVSRTAYGPADGERKTPKRPFDIIDSRKGEDGKFPLLSESDGRPYAGCFVNALVRFWAQDDEDYGKRINASIEAVQFKRHGEAFGGGKKVDVHSTFEDEGDEDDFAGGSGSGAAADDDDDGLI